MASKCFSMAVIRMEDRAVLVRHDSSSPSSPPAVVEGNSSSKILGVEWSVVCSKVAAGSVNRTRMQVDLMTAPSTDGAGAGAGAGAAGAQIHAVVSRPKNIAVAAICNAETSSRTAFVLCDTALAQFERMFVERASSLSPEQCQPAFAEVLSDAVAKFNSAMAQVSDDGRVAKVKEAVEMTKVTVLENIDRALDRGSKIDNIVEASADLSENAQSFQRASVDLERTMMWKAWKMKLTIAGIIAVLVLVLVMVVCGSKCLPGGSKKQ